MEKVSVQFRPGAARHACRRLSTTLKLIAGLLSATLVAACSPMSLLNVTSPSSHYERMANISYGDHARQTLDVYLPKQKASSAPLVVFYYGGGWRGGDKAKYEFVASALSRAGMVVVIPDYRLFPDVTFPSFVDDGAAAAAWALENVEQLGANPDQVFVMGHSAGAHIAAMLAFDERYMGAAGLDEQPFAGFIGLSGPYDFLPLQEGYLERVFPKATRESSQPIDFVSAYAPPTLLIHGTDDRTVWKKNSENLAAKLQQSGVDVTLTLYDGVGHARVVAALAPPFDFLAQTLNDTKAFVSRADLARRDSRGILEARAR